jgi:hypothetical protein
MVVGLAVADVALGLLLGVVQVCVGFALACCLLAAVTRHRPPNLHGAFILACVYANAIIIPVALT